MKKIINPWEGMSGYNCIGCSPDHPFGFHLHFYEDGEDIVSQWQPTADFQGWVNTLHGGIQALLLDEICGWEPMLTLRAHVVEQKRSFVTISATLSDSSGTVCTEATCIYFVFPKEKAEKEMHFKECHVEE